MISLRRHFRCGGFDTKVIFREGRVALLEKSKPGGTETYEVVILQHRPSEVIFGKPQPARESMPCSESWGVAGWSYNSREDAEEKFRELVHKSQLSAKEFVATASSESATP
jgi:hypothetical protein